MTKTHAANTAPQAEVNRHLPEATDWSVAVFAHNEARTITSCLDAILAQRPERPFPVFVLINGSRDATERKVRAFARLQPQVLPVLMPLGDKANAWNEYVHTHAPDASIHFFVDGDTTPLPYAFTTLARTMQERPEAVAVGALPASGRDRIGWSRRMQVFGRLAGCLYALRGSYLDALRASAVRMPVGMIGEDLLLSCLVKQRYGAQALSQPDRRLAFAAGAGFAFRSMSPKRPCDWIAYARRLVRYRVRDYQLAILLAHLAARGPAEMPADVATLYRMQAELPRYQWRGRATPLDLLAIRRIRKTAGRRPAA